MCGIVAVLGERDDRPPLAPDLLAPVLLTATGLLTEIDDPIAQMEQFRDAVQMVQTVDHRLRSLPGVRRMVDDQQVQATIGSAMMGLADELARIDTLLDKSLCQIPPPHLASAGLASAGLASAGLASAGLGTEATVLSGRLADSVFGIVRDRLRTATAIAGLHSASGEPPRAAVGGLWAIQVALSSLDRLEVRGRDSAGLQVFVAVPSDGVTGAPSDGVTGAPSDGVVMTPAGRPFLYKVAAEIGELGDNTAALRKQISADTELHKTLAIPGARVSVLAHTRWASVGIISEPNTHPLDGSEVATTEAGCVTTEAGCVTTEAGCATTASGLASADSGIHCAAVLNGDVDNYADLKEINSLRITSGVTTDAKVIPTLLRRALETARPHPTPPAVDLLAAFTKTVNDLDGSVAIAAHSSYAPGCLALALRGSGQALYVGATESAYIVASEPYGLVEEVDCYLRMAGDTSTDPTDPVGSRGQIILLDLAAAPRLLDVERYSYDGTALPVTEDDITTAVTTTRDIDRGDAPHFFLKEIREAPRSFRTTLRGRIEHYPHPGQRYPRPGQRYPHPGQRYPRPGQRYPRPGQRYPRPGQRYPLPLGQLGARATLGDTALPPSLRQRFNEGSIKQVVAIGQGTAAVAAAALPHFCEMLWDGLQPRNPNEQQLSSNEQPLPKVSACLATELSGFGMRDDMSDTVVVAVSQSGTTTDVNRTVELVRARDATVLAVVNRRDSDLTKRADGVLYTSDGRDVEMSVASTKAFYAQVAALALLAAALTPELRAAHSTALDASSVQAVAQAVTELLNALEAMPDAMAEVLASRAEIAVAARRLIGPRRHWAVVGNGANLIAAREIRIKLSELCYHAVAVDSTENKKHIDLSSEPLILICAAGTRPSVLADVAKEVDIYRAHSAAPMVFTTDADQFTAADVITVPHVHPMLDFVLGTVAGHLFAYEAARVIDSLADPLREIRAVVETAIDRHMTPGHTSATELLRHVAEGITAPATQLLAALQAGTYDGHLRVTTALRLATVLPFAQGVAALESYQQTVGKVGTPGVVIEDLEATLNTAIDDLTRPIDAIKHQAKSVTVGISRAEDSLLSSVLVTEALAAGAPRDRLNYAALQTLAALDPAVESVVGYTRYRIDGEVTADSGALHEAAIDLTRKSATIGVLDKGGIANEITSRTDEDPRLRGTKHRAAFEREVTVGRGSDGRTVVHIPETKDGRTTGLTLLHCQFAPTVAAHRMRAVLRGYRGRYGALVDAVTETLPVFDDTVLGRTDVVDLLTRPVYVLAESWITPSSAQPDIG